MGKARSAAAIAIALALVGPLAPGSAAAKSSALILQIEGQAAAKGTPTTVALNVSVDGYVCEQDELGTLATNGKSKDKVTASEEGRSECSEEAKVTGLLKQVELAATDQVTIKAKPALALTIPGPCVYEVTKASGELEIPGFAEVSLAPTAAKLNSKHSSRSCAATATLQGELVIFETATGETYETEE